MHSVKNPGQSVKEQAMDAAVLIVAGPVIQIVRSAVMDTAPVKQTARTAIAVLRIASAVNNPKEIARTASKGVVTGNAIRTKMGRTVRTARRTLSPTVAETASVRGMRTASIARSTVVPSHQCWSVGMAIANLMRTRATVRTIVAHRHPLKLTARMVSTMTVTAIPTVPTKNALMISPAPVDQGESRVRRTANVAQIGATEVPASSDRQ